MLRFLTGLWLLACTLGGQSAHADDLAASRSAFQKGVKQMQDGGCKSSPVKAVALCKLAAANFSQALELNPSGLGALKNLARVTQSLGQLRAAAVFLAKLRDLAAADPDPARRMWAEFADTEAKALAQRIPKLVVEVVQKHEEDLYVVRVNGTLLPAANLGTPLAYDPGSYELTLNQGGHEVLRQIAVLSEGETLRVVLALKQQPVAPTQSNALQANSSPKTAPPSHAVPLALTLVGGAGVLGGLGFGYVALSARDAGCDADAHTCTGGKLKNAKSAANISTFLTLGGAVLFGGGLTWYFLQPNAQQGAATDQLAFSVAPAKDGGELHVSGAF